MMHRTTLLLLAAILALLPACSRALQSVPKSELPETFWLASAPEGAQDVILARVMATDGGELVVQGRVAELSDQRAQLELVDSSFTPCDEREGDTCKTPWDYCCEEPTTLAGGTVVVEFREAGQLMRTPVRGFHGCDHLVHATVRGRAELDEAGNLILVASGIHVAP